MSIAAILRAVQEAHEDEFALLRNALVLGTESCCGRRNSRHHEKVLEEFGAVLPGPLSVLYAEDE